MPVPCTTTGKPDVGGTCSLSTTFNAVVPGTVVEGKRSSVAARAAQVNDGGSTGVAGASDATLFATQGVFVP